MRVQDNFVMTSRTRRSLTMSFSCEDYQLIMAEAVRKHMTVAEYAKSLMQPTVEKLRVKQKKISRPECPVD